MLIYLTEYLAQFDSGFGVFRYITLRTILAVLTALVISFLVGPAMIRRLSRYKIGQTVRDDGPESHFSKAGTPTMGGALLLVAIALSALLWSDLGNRYVWVVLLVTLLACVLYLGCVGVEILGIHHCRDAQQRRFQHLLLPVRELAVFAQELGLQRLGCCLQFRVAFLGKTNVHHALVLQRFFALDESRALQAIDDARHGGLGNDDVPGQCARRRTVFLFDRLHHEELRHRQARLPHQFLRLQVGRAHDATQCNQYFVVVLHLPVRLVASCGYSMAKRRRISSPSASLSGPSHGS